MRLALPEEWARGEISPDITSRLTEDTPARARDARTDTRGSTNTRARARSTNAAATLPLPTSELGRPQHDDDDDDEDRDDDDDDGGGDERRA